MAERRRLDPAEMRQTVPKLVRMTEPGELAQPMRLELAGLV